MDKETIQALVNIRMTLIENFQKRNDWRSNRNAIMREIEHIELIGETIKKIDALLSDHVTFS